ncbi:hypothetical protein A2V68_00475 [candidate division Kazan bacterium RBG_13_50_9]|uniref:ComEC/Rec2-related protein domain-containing protein n=1 Tax=candidate division Kazan bacterium RBG_13_50_9 TaxID=1798535 RepID=A0A1F4NS29_UNCK3|nr:MAG: hypothetical protein A2V68_00475 [candidate division Kazan bacterium RBG_13_50_9]
MQRTQTILLLLGLIIGIALGPIFSLGEYLILLWFIAGLVGIALIWRRHRYLLMVIVLVGAVAVGNFRFSASNYRSERDVSHLASQPIDLTGIVVDDPQVTGELVRFTLQVKSVSTAAPIEGKVLITTRRYPTLEYGNVLVVSGQLKLPTLSQDFDYPAYLSRFGVYSVMDYPNITKIQLFQGNIILGWLYRTKGVLIAAINQILPEPSASLLAGLLFGARRGLPDELLESFNTTGLTHIIALSGFNITIIAGAVMGWLKFIPLRLRVGITLLAIAAFVLLTGASPSVTRAAIMGGLILWAGLSGRLHDITLSLLWAAAIMALHNPRIVNYDVGFQLSFLSTVGIIYLSPVVESWWPKWLHPLTDYLSPTLSALIFVTPVIAYNFGRISLIASLANLLILPVIPIAMGLGFIATLFGAVQIAVGTAAGLLAWLPLQFIVSSATWLASWPASSFTVTSVSPLWMVLYYFVLSGLLIYWYAQRKAATRRSGGSLSRI